MKFLLWLLGFGRAERKRNEFIAGPRFLQTAEWKRARYDALRASDGRCQLCGPCDAGKGNRYQDDWRK